MSWLPEGWAWAAPEAVAAPVSHAIAIGPFGSDLKVADYRSNGVPLVFVREIKAKRFGDQKTKYIDTSKAEALARHYVRSGDVLITKMGDPPGDAVLYPDSRPCAIITADCIKLTPNIQVAEPRYLVHSIHSESVRSQIVEQSAGVAQQKISLERFRAIKLPLAPRPEQKRIADKLDALFARVDACRERLDRIPSILKRFRQSVLAAATSGELTREWRTLCTARETTAEVLSRTPTPTGRDTGRAAGVKSRPGMYALSVGPCDRTLPQGWQWVALSRVAKLESGHTPSRAHTSYWNGGIPWIGIPDARENHGGVVEETAQTVSQEGLDNSSARLLPARTVCLSRTASVGYVTIMGRPMATSQDFANWLCTPALLPEYLMYALMAEGDRLKNFGEGSTHTTIYFPELKALHIALPPPCEQAEIIRRSQDLLRVADEIEVRHAKGRDSVATLTPSVLAKAFRGELVPQDPNDEPAAALLARIAAARDDAGPSAGRTRRRKTASTGRPA